MLTAQLLPAQKRTLYKLAEPEVPSWLSMCVSASRGVRSSAKGKREEFKPSRDTSCYQETVFPGVTQKGQRKDPHKEPSKSDNSKVISKILRDSFCLLYYPPSQPHIVPPPSPSTFSSTSVPVAVRGLGLSCS